MDGYHCRSWKQLARPAPVCPASGLPPSRERVQASDRLGCLRRRRRPLRTLPTAPVPDGGDDACDVFQVAVRISPTSVLVDDRRPTRSSSPLDSLTHAPISSPPAIPATIRRGSRRQSRPRPAGCPAPTPPARRERRCVREDEAAWRSGALRRPHRPRSVVATSRSRIGTFNVVWPDFGAPGVTDKLTQPVTGTLVSGSDSTSTALAQLSGIRSASLQVPLWPNRVGSSVAGPAISLP